MSRVDYRFFRMCFVLLSFVQRKSRSQEETTGAPADLRGLAPPYMRPSSACLALGTRVSCSLFTPSRVARNRGGGSSAGRSKARENCSRACNGLGLRRQRHFLGHGPHKRTQLPGNGDDHLVGVFPSGDQLSVAFAQASLGLPTTSWMGLGPCSRRSGRGRLPWPESDRPRPLRSGPGGHGYSQPWGCRPDGAAHPSSIRRVLRPGSASAVWGYGNG